MTSGSAATRKTEARKRGPAAAAKAHASGQSVAGTLGLVAAIALISFVVAYVVSGVAARGPFSPTRWMLASNLRTPEMAAEYLERHFVEGMSIDEVLTDLGDPSGANDIWSYTTSLRDPSMPSYLANAANTPRPALVVWFHPDGRVGRLTEYHLDWAEPAADFDEGAWKSAAETDRSALARALFSSGLPDSWGKAEVEAYLGGPDGRSDTWCCWYDLVDRKRLEVSVGADRRVLGASIDTLDD